MSPLFRVLPAFALLFSIATPTQAILPFHKQFVEFYAGDDSTASDEFKELVNDKKQRCFICHQGKKSKKNHNPYGEALAEHLTKKDKNDVEKIVAAFETVAEQSSNPDDPDAPTFGELIAEGKLPGGSYEECAVEPED